MSRRADFLQALTFFLTSARTELKDSLRVLGAAYSVPEEAFPEVSYDVVRDFVLFASGEADQAPAWLAEVLENAPGSEMVCVGWDDHCLTEWWDAAKKTWEPDDTPRSTHGLFPGIMASAVIPKEDYRAFIAWAETFEGLAIPFYVIEREECETEA